MVGSRWAKSFVFFSWILVLFSSQCGKTSGPGAVSTAEMFEEVAKAFEKWKEVGRLVQQSGVANDGEKDRLLGSMVAGEEEAIRAFAKAEKAARWKAVKAAKSKSLEEAKTFEEMADTFDALEEVSKEYVDCFNLFKKQLEKDKKTRAEKGFLLELAMKRAEMLAFGVSTRAGGATSEAFKGIAMTLGLILISYSGDEHRFYNFNLVDSDSREKAMLEAEADVARMFKEIAKEARSRTK